MNIGHLHFNIILKLTPKQHLSDHRSCSNEEVELASGEWLRILQPDTRLNGI